MKDSMQAEMSCPILKDALAGDNALIQYYQDTETGLKNVRFRSIESGRMTDQLVSRNFEQIEEVTDQETGVTTWRSSDGKRIEFNDKGIAVFNKEGELSELFDLSKPVFKGVGGDFIDVIYLKLFERKPPKVHRKVPFEGKTQ